MKYGLFPTGGSDFHGANKPDIAIGCGRGTCASRPASGRHQKGEEQKTYRKDFIMEELYRTIEETIRNSGCPFPADGEEIYNEICDEIENRNRAPTSFFSKKDG